MSDPPTGRPRGPVRPGSVEAPEQPKPQEAAPSAKLDDLERRIVALEKKDAEKAEENEKLLAELRAVHGDSRLFRF